MICKVSRGKLRKLILERFWLWVTWCRILGNPLAQCDMSMKGEADENLPKWSWSPLSRSSSWSWSRSSVPCDVGVHQPNCRGPCRTFGSTRKKFWLNFLSVWEVALPALSTPLCLQPICSHAHVGFPKGGERTQFEKVKKRNLDVMKKKALLMFTPEKINTKSEFCTLQGFHRKGGKVQLLKPMIIKAPRGTQIYLGFSAVSKPAQTGLLFHLA